MVLSLPTENATVRQRAWRSLKAAGAAALRDGVYVLPAAAEHRAVLEAVAVDVTGGGGATHLLTAQATDEVPYVALFDRSRDYTELLADATRLRESLPDTTPSEALKHSRKLRRTFESITAIDFFPGEARRQVEDTLAELEMACARLQAPDEPRFVAGTIQRLRTADYQGRLWATRRRPWVDRLASAWLIRRFIDPEARILWLTHPADCPPEALGFDFDGATFSHVAHRVTFEVLAASFGLEQGPIARVGLLVHYLDVGGAPPPEASGVESVLAGLRDTVADDDQLLERACAVFDGLLASFRSNGSTA
ncbi:chromate resistance protein ChrB domain-containing protein [Stenotrophomonas sp. AR026]|uniref:chromate resistance protein ChrB domain-containing protein n=1 Tax=Stenotrophomonas sp. AR026 TaxID=3398462 RepID=UPI003BAF3801